MRMGKRLLDDRVSIVVTLLMAAVLAALMLWGCGSAENTWNCAEICEAYEDCVDEGTDVSECTSSCLEQAEKDDSYAAQVDECEACIDDKSCLEGAFQCSLACAGVVP